MSTAQAKRHKPRRTQLTSVNDDGSRYIIHPADTTGIFTNWRRILATLLILFYAALPWIKIGGYPAVFLDTNAMRFHFFGLTFVSHDIWLGFFLITGLGFGLFYITSLFGRIWLGLPPNSVPRTCVSPHRALARRRCAETTKTG
jgi:hypothetical protein